MPQKPFIKNIDQLVKDTLQELKLKPKLALAGFIKKDKRFYTTPCQTKTKETVLFKMLISAESPDPELLKKEIILTKILSDYSQKNKGLPALNFIQGNTETLPYWIIRQYLPGPIIGYHFEIYKQGLTENVRKGIVKNLLLTQAIPLGREENGLSEITLPQKTARGYLNVLQNFENELKLWRDGVFSNKLNFKQIYQFFNNKQDYLKKHNFVLAHGDLTLANFFIHPVKSFAKNKRKSKILFDRVKRPNVYLTDWEHARKDNLSADIARLWIQTYQYPQWRKSLLKEFLASLNNEQKNAFQESFCLIALIEAVSEFFCDLLKTIEDTPLKQSCQQTIMLAQKGFDNLLSF